MAGTDEELVAEIRRDLECPQCRYNLRGLSGDVVSCPECGAAWDVARLTGLPSTNPWLGTPEFGIVILPAASLLLGLPVVFLALQLCLAFGSMVWMGVLLALLVCWVWLVFRAWRAFESAEGLYLVLASHLMLAGCVAGFFGFLVSVVAAVDSVDTPVFAGGWGLVAAALALTFWQSFRAEVFIGKRCVHRYHIKNARV